MTNKSSEDEKEPSFVKYFSNIKVTKSAFSYKEAVLSDFGTFGFFCHETNKADALMGAIHKTLSLAGQEPVSKPIKKDNTQLRHSLQTMLEMIFSRLVDNFNKYLVDIIEEILLIKPEILSSSEQTISTEEVLKIGDYKSLIHFIIEKRIRSLSNKGLEDIKKWCDNKGIPFDVKQNAQPTIKEMLATRNIIVHNRCLIDKGYINIVGKTALSEGDKREIEYSYLEKAYDSLTKVVFDTDSIVIKKFGVKSSKVK
ncbi:MAG: hypothetical protein GY777_29660 [Candidatus Brocadiaceae bacterium]|nr:hypothetical protein [Candidatus Brocadiaceae bacterium]